MWCTVERFTKETKSFQKSRLFLTLCVGLSPHRTIWMHKFPLGVLWGNQLKHYLESTAMFLGAKLRDKSSASAWVERVVCAWSCLEAKGAVRRLNHRMWLRNLHEETQMANGGPVFW